MVLPPMTAAWRWAVTALVIYGAIVGLVLIRESGNPEWFIHFGTESTVINEGRRVLGARLLIPHKQGQDGQTFWLMARDPLLLHPARDAAAEDRPAYREQRLLYPLLASPFRVFGERSMVWALLAVNLAAVVLGTYWATDLARSVGAPERFALAYSLNPAVLTAVMLDTSDAVAIAFVICGVALWMRRKDYPTAWAGAAFALAALAKEVMILAPLVLAVVALARRRRREAFVVLAPGLAAIGAWGLYVRARLSWPATKIEELTWPFSGFHEAYVRGWRPFHDWGPMAVAIACLVAMGLVVAAWMKWRADALTAALPFAVMYVFLSGQVLDVSLNSVRATGPALTLAGIVAAARLIPTEPAIVG